MTDRELQKLSRRELLEMLVSLSEENESLREKLEATEKKLNSRDIQIANAGSIAEAAVVISGVFSAAQDAADRYLENIKRMNREAEESTENRQDETNGKNESTGKADSSAAET